MSKRWICCTAGVFVALGILSLPAAVRAAPPGGMTSAGPHIPAGIANGFRNQGGPGYLPGYLGTPAQRSYSFQHGYYPGPNPPPAPHLGPPALPANAPPPGEQLPLSVRLAGAGAGSRPEDYPYYSSAAPQDLSVVVNVHVPTPNAEVWFEDAQTHQTGEERAFRSPPLTSGGIYTYHIRARWQEAGQTIDQTQTVPVRPGDRVWLSFPTPQAPEKPK